MVVIRMKWRFLSTRREQARITELERLLVEARSEIVALKFARDAALRIATWGWRRETKHDFVQPKTLDHN
jgi:hypothetical protein